MNAFATSPAQRILDEGCGPLGIDEPALADPPRSEALEWAQSGGMALTGLANGPPRLTDGSPATTLCGALAVVAACTGTAMPGSSLLGEHAALTGGARNAPWSVGGTFRAVRARDGWLGLSLSRPSDIELLPALVEGSADGDPWAVVGCWAAGRTVEAAPARAVLLGLPAAAVAKPPHRLRPPSVVATPGGRRVRDRWPLVLDLSSLWAGPLCAHLLGLGGARVVKVESLSRPDGMRAGCRPFFDLMHDGHESVAIDFGGELGLLRALLARADVVLESSRPRALAQLGVDVGQYVADGCVWVSITAGGREPGTAMRVGFGDDVAAGAGLVVWEAGVPHPVADAIADPLAGATAAAAASLALRSERGCVLDVSMHHVAAAAAIPTADDPAEVEASGAGWIVTSNLGRCAVADPSARHPASTAPALGAHTASVRREFALR
jgi:hypothetical protein